LTIDDFPFVLHDTSPTNRVFRRDFWEGTVGGFPDSADGESFAVVSATLQARKFDLLQAITSIERPRLNPRKLLPDPLPLSELDSRLNWLFATWRLVHDSAGSTIAGGVLGRLIDHDLGNLAADGHRADDLYRARLQKAAQECLAMADDNVWPYVRVDRKLRIWLVANARWSDLDQLVQHSRLYGSIPRTEIRDGRLYAVAADLPAPLRPHWNAWSWGRVRLPCRPAFSASIGGTTVLRCTAGPSFEVLILLARRHDWRPRSSNR
jgi:hypothetical protein